MAPPLETPEWLRVTAAPRPFTGALGTPPTRAAVRRVMRRHLSATPLHRMPDLAAAIGAADFCVKDETSRDGLGAFKALGVRYAFERFVPSRAPITVACASAGNHGLAVARLARQRHVPAVVYVPGTTPLARVRAIEAEGARVRVCAGTYDDVLMMLRGDAACEGWTVIADSSWDGYRDIPAAIIEGYTWMMEECLAHWDASGIPDLAFVQAGVGGLAAAVAGWLRDVFGDAQPAVVVCEASAAPCLLRSTARARLTAVPAGGTAMSGLACGTPSPLAWEILRDCAAAFMTVTDRQAHAAVERLGAAGWGRPVIRTAPSGACGVAGAFAFAQDPGFAELRRALEIPRRPRVLTIVTEGAG
jgi:diaminopropionate ammonia-lyase